MRWIERHTTWIGFLFAFAGGVMVASFWMYREAKNFWEVLTAIGTIGATLAAVFIALRDARWRRETRESEALIAWGLLAPQVVQMIVTLRRVQDAVRARRGLVLGVPHSNSAEITGLIRSLQFNGGVEVVFDKLAYLPNQKGAHVGMAMGMLPVIAARLEAYDGERHAAAAGEHRTAVLDASQSAIERFEEALELDFAWHHAP